MFAHPLLLLLLPLAPLAAWRWRVRKRPAIRFPQTSIFDGLPCGRAPIAEWGGAVGRGLILALCILAAAGPRTPDAATRLPAEGIAIVLVVDVSGSMSTATGGVTRLDAAKQTFRAFVQGGDGLPGRPNDALALVTFAALPDATCPLTLNHDVLLALLDEQAPRSGVDAGTNVGDALAEALLRLEAAGNVRKVIVLLSDGEHNATGDGPLRPLAAGQLAHALGVPVYAIDCGGEPAGDAGAVAQRSAGRKVLADLADLTAGRFFPANSAGELREAVKQIDALEKRPLASFRTRKYRDHTPAAAFAAFGLLALGGLLESTWLRRFP